MLIIFVLARSQGFEPRLSKSVAWRLIQLGYGSICFLTKENVLFKASFFEHVCHDNLYVVIA